MILFPNIYEHIPPIWVRCHNSELPAAWKSWWDGWKKDLQPDLVRRNLFFCNWLNAPPPSYLHFFPYNNISRKLRWLRFSKTWEKQIHRKCKETPLSLSLCRFRSEVATSHQDVTILRQVGTHPVSQWCITLWQGHVVLQTKSGIYPAGHKESLFSNGIQEWCRAIISEPGLKSEKPKCKCLSAYWLSLKELQAHVMQNQLLGD